MKFIIGDYINLVNSHSSGEIYKLLLRVFFVEENRVYAEVIDKKKNSAYGIAMTGAFGKKKMFTGYYFAGRHEEFEFNLEENLKRNKIKLKDIYGLNMRKALESSDKNQREYARDSIIQQIFRK